MKLRQRHAEEQTILLDRRSILFSAAGVLLARSKGAAAMVDLEPVVSQRCVEGADLASAPIDLAGAWGKMLPGAAEAVLARMRLACLGGIRLLSDRQPTRLIVDEHRSGPPAVWLHSDRRSTAWLIVDIGERAWSQLAYQFGHELGHTFANSWQWHAKPGGTCQWIEEAMVEAFSLFGLGRLAADWKKNPPFANDNAYGDAIASYRASIESDYRKLSEVQGGVDDMRSWFARHQAKIEAGDGLNDFAKAAALQLLHFYDQNPRALEAIGALNRWPKRTRLLLAEYMSQWEASCAELGASTALVKMLRTRLRI